MKREGFGIPISQGIQMIESLKGSRSLSQDSKERH